MLAIIATNRQVSHTWDEPTHVVAGREFLQDGGYTFQTENPPMSRVVLAVVPYLRGMRLPPPDRRQRGFASDLFYATPNYVANVTAGRVANVAFFWTVVALTWVLAGGRKDPWVALLASAAVATLPAIVAHSGFATTDIAFVASLLLVLLAMRSMVGQPIFWRAAFVGLCMGLATATKFTTLIFCRRWQSRFSRADTGTCGAVDEKTAIQALARSTR